MLVVAGVVVVMWGRALMLPLVMRLVALRGNAIAVALLLIVPCACNSLNASPHLTLSAVAFPSQTATASPFPSLCHGRPSQVPSSVHSEQQAALP